MLRKILFGGDSGHSPLTNAGLAALRSFAGAALLFGHGIGKVPPSEKLIEMTGKLGFPLPTFFAYAASMTEFAGGAFLALGLFTRVSSFFIAFSMTVAAFGVHLNDGFAKQEKALLYLFVAVAFLFKGAGDWSLDALIRQRQ